MGQLIVEQLVTADGYTSDPGGGMSFVPPDIDSADKDLSQVDFLERVDAIVIGRRTYEMFAAFWPHVTAAQDRVSVPINTLPLHVVTNTLTAAPWGEHRPGQVERGDGVATVRALKQRYERDIVLWGSLTLADHLFHAGEVNRIRLRTLPTLTGQGRRLAPPLDLVRLTLVTVEQHSGGQVTLEYELH